MIKDRVTLGFIVGLIGALAMELPGLLLYKLGIIKYLALHIAATAFIADKFVFTPAGVIVGLFANCFTGGVVGIFLALFLREFKTDQWLLKGLMVGGIVWLIAAGVIFNILTKPTVIPFEDPAYRLYQLFSHCIYGVLTVFLLDRWKPIQNDSLRKA